MAELKTHPTDVDVAAFLDTVEPPSKRADAEALAAMFARVTDRAPRMWGPSIVGFGSYHYRYASGHEGDAALAAFSPRKTALTLYILGGFDRYQELLAKLGTFKLGKGCLYVKRLADVDRSVLEALVTASVAYGRATFETT